MPNATKAWTQEDILVINAWMNPYGQYLLQARVVSRKVEVSYEGIPFVEYGKRIRFLRPKKTMMPFIRRAMKAGIRVGDSDFGGKPFPLNKKHYLWLADFDASVFEGLELDGVDC